MSDWYIADSQADFDEFDTLDRETQIVKKIESWQKIFDIQPVDNGWERRGMFIQATFWELNKEDIIKVKAIQYKS